MVEFSRSRRLHFCEGSSVIFDLRYFQQLHDWLVHTRLVGESDPRCSQETSMSMERWICGSIARLNRRKQQSGQVSCYVLGYNLEQIRHKPMTINIFLWICKVEYLATGFQWVLCHKELNAGRMLLKCRITGNMKQSPTPHVRRSTTKPYWSHAKHALILEFSPSLGGFFSNLWVTGKGSSALSKKVLQRKKKPPLS
ncbi:hypothetical protein VNO77_08801 [Canavalia gladiata]|uniref:Uncharacterized protein n=1 Tax=Canavalia gladiata TaxID=3824 RepID=A0AAN9MAA6_CANGL